MPFLVKSAKFQIGYISHLKDILTLLIMESLKIGDKLRTLRDLHGIKQEDIAQRLGISQNTYSKLETGETDLTISRLEEIAKIYNLKPMDLFNFDPKYIIHQMHNQSVTIHGDIIQSNFEKEIELYKDQITQLKEENKFLKDMIEHLKKKES